MKKIVHWCLSFLNRRNDKEKKRPIPPLVKSRPSSLFDRYEVLTLDDLGDEVFHKLRREMFQRIDGEKNQTIFREYGKIAPGRPYFYLKPPGGKGLLFERSGSGWVLTFAEKIVAQDLFVREQTPLDQVVLYMAKDQALLPRVMSTREGDELVAFKVYEQHLFEAVKRVMQGEIS